MYDLEALRYLNEQAHLRAVEIANQVKLPSKPVGEKTKAVLIPSPVFPLSILARKLLGGPPSLNYFVELLEQGEYFRGFRDLVREYLPEYEVNIMAEDLPDRATKFTEYFSEKFFPLWEDLREGFSISDLLDGIPTQPLGFSYESYHAFTDFRSGYILALALVESPYDEDPLGGDFEDEEEEGMQGGRIPVLEAASQLVSEGLLQLIPKNGWDSDNLRRMTDDTEFDGLGDFAEWVEGVTGFYFLDAHGESLETGQQIEWDREIVDDLTNDWQESFEMLQKMHRLALLLEQDSETTFRRLLALLLDKQDLIIPKEQLSLALT